MEQNIDLSGLRDIHIPLQPNIFPLALGWWILIILLIVTYFVIFSKTHSLKRQVWREYKKISKIENNIKLLKEMNRLAKRVAIVRFGREKIAHLYEDEWVVFMNSLLQNEIFSNEYIDLLHKSMYAKNYKISDELRIHILQDYKKWLKTAIKKQKQELK